MKDLQIKKLIALETARQKKVINLIPSENYASADVFEALGSIFDNKYAEGYPGKRYYGGNPYTDKLELLCQERARKAFGLDVSNSKSGAGRRQCRNCQGRAGHTARYERHRQAPLLCKGLAFRLPCRLCCW